MSDINTKKLNNITTLIFLIKIKIFSQNIQGIYLKQSEIIKNI